MNRSWAIAAVALALAACASVGPGGRTLEPPQVTLADLEFRDLGLLEQRLGLVLRLSNPNEVSLPLDGLKVSLVVDGEPFATGLSNENVTVPALGEERVTVDAVSTTTDLLNQLQGVTDLQDVDYTLAGTAFLRGSDQVLPFTQEGVVRLSGFAE